MKSRVLSLLGVLALTAGTVIQAQDYDDIYYDGSKTSTEVKKETKKVETARTRTQVPTSYKVTVEKNYQNDRDVDEYNRRGGIYSQSYNDTLYIDSTYLDESAFGNTQRIERFYNPDVIINSDDDELIELYYDNAPTVNLVIGSNYGYTPHVGWGIGYGSYWYDPWYSLYDPFYDPFYYGWHRPYYSGWYGWHSPYWSSWSWGWHSAWYGWHDPWMRPWGYHGPHMWSYGNIYHDTRSRHWNHGGHSNRLPGDNRSLLSGARRGSGMNTAGTQRGIRSTNGTTRGSVETINNGRVRPSTIGNIGTSRQRPSSAIGNTSRSTSTTSGTFGNGSVRNRGTSSGSSYSGSSSRSSNSTRSYSPSSSYGGSRSSSYGSSSRSSGSYSSGSSRGGGFSGGSSRGSSGSSSGGGRRH